MERCFDESTTDVSSLDWDHNITQISLQVHTSDEDFEDVFTDAPEIENNSVNEGPPHTDATVSSGTASFESQQSQHGTQDPDYSPDLQDMESDDDLDDLNVATLRSASSTVSGRTRSSCSDQPLEEFSRTSVVRQARRPVVRENTDNDVRGIHNTRRTRYKN